VADPCPRCGLAQPVASCPRRQTDWRVARIVAPFDYAAPLDHYVRALKYHAARNLGRALGLLLAAQLPLDDGVDALVPVPLHPSRLEHRGYNQATEIARALARERALPLVLRGVERVRHGPAQSGQTAARRRASMVAAFAARGLPRGATFAIVDDVITTGATVNALAAALLDGGAGSVQAWAVARTPV
jgi:ComF family protein